jgi:hypothetical protein
MYYPEVVNHWESIFEKMGYRETKPNNWFEETKDLIIVLRVLTIPPEVDFYVDVGIIIKKLYDVNALNYPVFRYYHLGQSLWLLLYKLGEKKRNLDKLFCFDRLKNTDEKVIANISKLAMLYQAKVIPLLDEIDKWACAEENFEEKRAWDPFYQYFMPSLNVDQCYW